MYGLINATVHNNLKAQMRSHYVNACERFQARIHSITALTSAETGHTT